ncbi:16S rRNA (cytosine(1402)-N(4))-methyltransferase RsmH [Paramagnetospirillum magneticum]|uniref:Ribosomal RNA small subunit methyltransferase H n=1 Tax=Paramagnetospirillum magneticum (strain ATCC 700264 / AMB-1) TaxID=342108 RepID=RSMH_PARM1|nr:16S rRNA (cytosine(1402)-N(4))-methyltransferase RsmH [Paramagnetospirillum magneticum]Q2W0I1.1 RecName: Full=Ribosomal RNA small subunit methyltransferase H; AltName: Full=16S rRNA m(4)C1402 methyltransferase; AltName: Full=rRNA (cytosine-N(4)-)-methyltransferase RsmH [Paramagnetospirillum magneticum AMB-1]BAE52644.1 S-adenosyl-methyltransferase mraW [Paramagnetospirillum magneticum AMB-1]
MSPQPHIPVLLAEVIAALAPRNDGVYLDGTFGAGGYSRAILAASACRVWAIDRDPTAVARGKLLEEGSAGRFSMIEGRFGDMDSLLRQQGVNQVDGIALDIGVSSMQIDQPERGFSFAKDGPLDMRMETKGPSAADMVNDTPETELANIIYRYGEERLSRRVAKAIVEARRLKRFERTGELAEVVRKVVPRSGDGIDPATRTFQALRIAVNDELGELERGLEAAERLLAPGGHLAVVTFHSLEDRVVKSFLKARSGEAARPSRHVPQAQGSGPAASFALLSRKAIGPAPDEARANPRARSAKLRAAARTAAPAWETVS